MPSVRLSPPTFVLALTTSFADIRLLCCTLSFSTMLTTYLICVCRHCVALSPFATPPDAPLTPPLSPLPHTIPMPVQSEYTTDIALPSSTDPLPMPSLHLNPTGTVHTPPLAAVPTPAPSLLPSEP